MTRIALGMSGGVDSSAAALLLGQQGYDVIGVTLSLCNGLCKPNNDIADAALICQRLGIEHYAPDLSDDFKSFVVNNFVDEYLNGRTPNPCIKCNRHIKFGAMLDYAKEKLCCDRIATGHYARISRQGDRFLLSKASDRLKDQTYMLYTLTQNQLAHSVFPLGEYTKEEIRQIAKDAELVTAERPDSQDICFVPDGDYAGFIQRYCDIKTEAGSFIDTDGNILGQHNGHIHYTVGQRKGLGIALGSPAFVLEKNAENNTVTLSTDHEKLFYKTVEVKDVNLIALDALTEQICASAKLRYRHTEQPAILHPIDRDRLIIEFDKPQRAPAPGQAAVFYDGETVIGGGIIVKGIK